MPVKQLTDHLTGLVRDTVERSRERREHDRAMSDPAIRDEHLVARSRATSRGETDCPYCG